MENDEIKIGDNMTAANKAILHTYVDASNAVRAADRNPKVSIEEYGKLIDAREQAFLALQAAKVWG